MCREYSFKGLLDVIGGESGVYSLEKKAGFSIQGAIGTEKLGVLCKILKCRVGDLISYVRKEEAVSLDSLQLKSKEELKKLLIERVREQYKNGEKTVTELSRETGLSDMTISSYIKDVETKVNKKDIRDKQILELKEAGKSAKEISEILGISLQTVYKIFSLNGIKVESKSVDENVKQQVLAEYKSKKSTVSQIAKKYNVSEAVVYKWARLKREGLEEPKERKLKESKFSDTAIQEIIKEYQAGSGIRYLSKKNKASPMTIKRLLEEANVYEGKRDIVKTYPSKEQILSLVRQGCSVKIICEKLQTPKSYVCSVVKNSKDTVVKPKKIDLFLEEWKTVEKDVCSYEDQDNALTLLASKYSLEKRNLRQALKNAGVEFLQREHNDAFILEMQCKARDMYLKGTSVKEICEKLDLKQGYVYSLLSGIKKQPTGNTGLSKEIIEQVLSLSKTKKVAEVAEELQISVSSVYKVLRENK